MQGSGNNYQQQVSSLTHDNGGVMCRRSPERPVRLLMPGAGIHTDVTFQPDVMAVNHDI
jgi:hypothetical protein